MRYFAAHLWPVARAAARRCLPAALMVAAFLGRCGAWHAYLDVEVLPSRPDAALSSDLLLPTLERRNKQCVDLFTSSGEPWSDVLQRSCNDYLQAPTEMCDAAPEAREKCCACGGGSLVRDTYEICEIARTSLRRAIVVCAADAFSPACSGECVASWNSVIRDAGNLVGSSCPSLEILMNEAYPFTMSGGALFQQDELEAIARTCEQFCPEDTGYCGLADPDIFVGASLRPPTHLCPDFKVTNGMSTSVVLTWQLLEHYRKEGLGCSGGLALLGDAYPRSPTHYESWACIHEPSCTYLALNDDMVCYKYSNIRGEFHYWGVNSNLTLADISFMINASFCDAEGAVLLQDARNVSQPIDLSNVHFTFTRDVSNGEKPHVVSGTARSNGRYGCGDMRLRKHAKYRLEINAGLSYYPYSSYVYTAGDNFKVNAAIMPVHGDKFGMSEAANCDSIGISLSWCERDPVDLDLFLFMPTSDGKPTPSEENAIYWSWTAGMHEQSNYRIKLERDDLGEVGNTGRRSYGPETIDMGGDLPVGTYAVMVHVHNPDGPDAKGLNESRLHGGCATVSIYSSMLGGIEPKGKFTWTLSPENDLLADWWHVFNLDVSETIEETMFQDGGTVQDTGGPDFSRYFDFVDIVTGVSEANDRSKLYLKYDVDTNGCIDEGEAFTNPGGMDAGVYAQASGGDACLSRIEFDMTQSASKLCLNETQASHLMGMESSIFSAVSGGDDCLTRDDMATVIHQRSGVSDSQNDDVDAVRSMPGLDFTYFSMVDLDEDGCMSAEDASGLFQMDSRFFALSSGNDACMSFADFEGMMDGKSRCLAKPSQRCVKSVSVYNVDMVVRPGLTVSEAGEISGSFPVPLESFSDDSAGGWLDQFTARTKQDWHEVFKPRDASMGTFSKVVRGEVVSLPRTSMYLSKYEGTTRQCHATWLEVEVLSAADMPTEANPLDFALVSLIEDEELWMGEGGRSDSNLIRNPEAVLARYERSTFSAGDLKVVRASSGVLVGGMKYFGRRSKILITAAGFFPQVYDIQLENGQYLQRAKIFAVPDDGLSRVILRWNDRPADCDIYVVPKEVVDMQQNPVTWRTDDGMRARQNPPYVFFDLCGCFDCTCSGPKLQGVGSSFTTVLELGRDDTTHGQPDAMGIIANGPETMSLLNLLPGKYLVYINAGTSTDGGMTFPSFDSYLKVEIALGNGTTSKRGPTISFKDNFNPALEGGKWFYAGYFHVTLPTNPVCDPEYRSADGSVKSLLHFEHGLCYSFIETDARLVKYTIEAGRDALDQSGSKVPGIQYSIDEGPWIYGLPDNGREHDPHKTPTTIKFKGTGFLDQKLEFPFFIGEWPQRLQSWMVKDDSKTHLVLRWGDHPEDLDMYLLPLGVHAIDEDMTLVDWSVMQCKGSDWNSTCGPRCGQHCGDWVQGHTNGDPLPWYPEFTAMTRPPESQTPFGGLNRDQAYLFYWQKEIKGVAPDLEFVEGQTLYPLLTQDRDDSGHSPPTLDNLDPWPNGPEGMTLQNLLPGTYELYITAWDNGDETQLLQPGLTLDVYLGNGVDKMVWADSVRPSNDISGAKWLYVGRIEVTSGGNCAPDSTARMMQWRDPSNPEAAQFCYSWFRGGVFSLWEEYFFQVSGLFDAVTNQRLGNAKYSFSGNTDSRVKGLVHRAAQGEHTLTMRMKGYVTRSVTLTFDGGFHDGCLHWPNLYDSDQSPAASAARQAAEACNREHWVKRYVDFLVPDDGGTRIVLRWGNAPSDLDTYVIPSGVVDGNGANVIWKAEMEDGSAEVPATETPYVFWGLCDICEDDCVCMSRTLVATANAASTSPLSPLKARISLDRDDRTHGDFEMGGGEAVIKNGPETTTFQDLLPGRYDVYINVYEEDKNFSGGVTVETYLGSGADCNGAGCSGLVDSLQWDVLQGRWFHAGFFVAHRTEAEFLQHAGSETVVKTATRRQSQSPNLNGSTE